MSALDQERTLRRVGMMSAIPPNITKCGSDVRLVPKADIRSLFDRLVGSDS